jgi:hypothetical protein
MPWPQSAAPDLHLERARDRVGRSRTAWYKIYSRDVFRGIHEFSSSLLKALLSYTSSKFRKSNTPPAARIRVNSLLGPPGGPKIPGWHASC